MTLFENTVIKSLRVRIDEPGLPEEIYHRTKWFSERGAPCGVGESKAGWVVQRIGAGRGAGQWAEPVGGRSLSVGGVGKQQYRCTEPGKWTELNRAID